MEIKQFVVVTNDPEFCLGTTLLYIDTRNTYSSYLFLELFLLVCYYHLKYLYFFALDVCLTF